MLEHCSVRNINGHGHRFLPAEKSLLANALKARTDAGNGRQAEPGMTPLRAVERARALRCPRNAPAAACYPPLWVCALTESRTQRTHSWFKSSNDKNLIRTYAERQLPVRLMPVGMLQIWGHVGVWASGPVPEN